MTFYGNPAFRTMYSFQNRWFYPLVWQNPTSYSVIDQNLYYLRDLRGPQIGLAITPVYPPYDSRFN